MAVCEGLTYQPSIDKIIGMVDVAGNNPEPIADQMFAIMIRGITKKWKQVIGYVLVKHGLKCHEFSII